MVYNAIFSWFTHVTTSIAIHESVGSVALYQFQLAVSYKLSKLTLRYVTRAHLAVSLLEKFFEENVKYIEWNTLLLTRADCIPDLAQINNTPLCALYFEFIKEAIKVWDRLRTQNILALFQAIAIHIDIGLTWALFMINFAWCAKNEVFEIIEADQTVLQLSISH